jgi:hypothetical protein
MAEYKVIAGTFHVKRYEPDGDSIRFKANNPVNWDFFAWPAGLSKSGMKQLRIEAIDAMETHYDGYHQPRPFALAALESLLELLDIKSVTYSIGVTQIVDATDGKPGFIAAGSTDRFGRPVSYLFPKKPGSRWRRHGVERAACGSSLIFSWRVKGWCIPRFTQRQTACLLKRSAR